MSRTRGDLLTCDRCGNTVFVICGDEGPRGWNWAGDIGHLCPKCSKEYKNIIKDFKERKRKDKKGDFTAEADQ